MQLVIVESPAKAKTIEKYLGRDFKVLASYGHVRDLPPKDGSVDPDDGFAMQWQLYPDKAKRLKDIQDAAKQADRLILATDPDREGEAISWHVQELLRQKKALPQVVDRVTFNAITKQAVADAMAAPRDIDQALVDAYLARRALDYLVGFNISPVLWRKLPGARSAGRVQSVALRLVCDRELEIEKFVKREYWSLVATLLTPAQESFEARLVGADGKKINRLDIGNPHDAKKFREDLETARFSVVSVEAKPARRHPYAPFTTSTLQQEASRKLGMAPAITMRVAQRLYEGVDIGGETVGLITYMRTDGVQMAPEAVAQTRRYIEKNYQSRYLPEKPRFYSSKQKNAQEAHEAIRPTDLFRNPAQMKAHLEPDAFRLYDLIWKRTVASQMESAELERTTADILASVGTRRLDLRATGQVVRFDGFLALYTEDKDDDDDEENKRLPAMKSGDPLDKKAIAATQHFTEPPPRFTEASLVKRMEELGIGRPSTYASTLAVLRDREYVRIEKKRLVPEDKGRIVTAFLESFFARYVEYDFTAGLEEQLDRISNSEIDWKSVLRDFWADFNGAIGGTKELRTTEVLNALDELLGPHFFADKGDGKDPRACPRCGNGRLSLKLGRTGPFIGCGNYPECRFTRALAVVGENGDGENALDADGVRRLGTDPETGLEVTARDGRFGPYVQLGEGEKPKRSSLPKGTGLAALTLEMALNLLRLPREVGKHPETGEPILAGIGRFGPYVQHGKTYANLTPGDDVLTIGLNRAVDLIATKESKGFRGRAGSAPQGRALGDHPDGGAVTVRPGKYGPYVNWGKVNATLPKSMNPDTITFDEALALVRAKEANGGGKPARAARTTRAKAAPADGDAAAKPAKKAPAKKTVAKKAPAKKG
ncbi:MAG: type I DNA topoisomerase [Proteobacteria bacterium]|nr:type I DNA topoisomerase [Pseudomonadota bacterium]